MEIDTRIPGAGLRWISIGNVRVWYENEWLLSMRILFYRKTIRISEIKRTPKKINDGKTKKKEKRKMEIVRILKKMIRMLKTFRVTEWNVAIDTDDYIRNAQLYPLNYLPGILGHLHINFQDENYVVLKIRNRPWKIIYAFLR